MSKGKSRKATQKAKPWWAYRKNRNRVWLALLGILAVAAIAGFFWLRSQDMGSSGEPQVGQQVQAFELPDVISGNTFSLADYLGNKDIVLVSYMGFF